MEKINYQDMVRDMAKPGADIIESLTPTMAHNLHMAVGVAGEAGELLDAVKKAAIYCKPADIENIIEELGDLEFYMEGIRQGFGITREQVIEHNIYKLATGPKARYKGGKYSNEAAIARADKQ